MAAAAAKTPLNLNEDSTGAPLGKDPKHPERDAKVSRMGTASIPMLITEFAIPAILGMLVNGAYNVIDSIFLGAGHGRDRPFGRHRGQSHHDRVHGAGHAGGQRRQRFGRAAPGRGKARGRRGQLGEYRILEPGVLRHRGLCRREPRHSGRAAHAFQRNRRRASLCAGVPADHLLRFRVPVHRHGREQLHPYRRRAEPRVGDHAHQAP